MNGCTEPSGTLPRLISWRGALRLFSMIGSGNWTKPENAEKPDRKKGPLGDNRTK